MCSSKQTWKWFLSNIIFFPSISFPSLRSSSVVIIQIVWKLIRLFSLFFQLILCAAPLPLACCHLPRTVGTFRPLLSPSTGSYRSHGEFLPMTAPSPPLSGPQPSLSTFHWRTHTAICLNKLLPAARPGTSGKGIRATASGMFWLFEYKLINADSTLFFSCFLLLPPLSVTSADGAQKQK